MKKTSCHILLVMSFLLLVSSLYAQADDTTPFSLYSDIKAHAVGDIVTILIVESANASQKSEVNSSGSANATANGSVSGSLSEYLPVFGLSTSVSSDRDGQQGTKQTDQLTGKISARIVDQTANGMFLIKGERLVEVSGETNIMQVEGYVRSRDIGNNNNVYSYNLADAKIIYRKKGLDNNLTKPGIIHRVGTWVLGAVLLVAAVTGVLVV